MSKVLRKLRWSLRHRGLAGTVKAAANAAGRMRRVAPVQPPHPFDVEHGTNTGGLIAGDDLASGHASDRFIEGYAAVPPSRFRALIERWQASGLSHPVAEYTFVDLGCGKGRALLLASQIGFREVVGVELNPMLAGIARSNVERWIAAGSGGSPIRVVQGDALEFAWPAKPCLGFLFNPFAAGMAQRVAERMAMEFRGREAGLEVLYYNPKHGAAFAKSFEMIWCETSAISSDDLAADPSANENDQTQAYRLLRR